MRFPYAALLSALVLAAPLGCAVDDDLVDTTGGGDSGGDGISLEASPPDSTVPDADMPDTTVESDTAMVDSTVPDTRIPDTFFIPDTVGFDLATIDTAVLDSFVGPTCATVAECPGTDLECAKRACVSGRCTVAFVPMGTPVAMQTPFDCKRNECDGAGLVKNVYDPMDLPNDNNECTFDVCPTATPMNTPTPAGSLCSKGGTMCDGAGRCVECLSASSCPGVDNECTVRQCITGICARSNVPFGPSSTQVAGDCKTVMCDGAGTASQVSASSDNDDGNPCTIDSCDGSSAFHSPAPSSTSCEGVYFCGDPSSSRAGKCGECDVDANCNATTPPLAGLSLTDSCRPRKCVSRSCQYVYEPSGTPCTLTNTFSGSVYCSSTCFVPDGSSFSYCPCGGG